MFERERDFFDPLGSSEPSWTTTSDEGPSVDAVDVDLEVPAELERRDHLKNVVMQVDDERVSEEEEREVTHRALDIFRRVLAPFRDYAVAASTAMYLQGIITKMPGDFDAVVFSEKTFRKIVDSLLEEGKRVSFYELPDPLKDLSQKRKIERGSPIRVMPDHAAKVICGEITVLGERDGRATAYRYPFEFFYDTKVMPDRLKKMVKPLSGFRVFTREALRDQYFLNFEMESAIDKAVAKVKKYLLEYRTEIEKEIKSIRAKKDSEPAEEDFVQAKKILNDFALSLLEVEKFYELLDRISSGELPEKIKAKYNDDITRLLSGGFKTKVEKRRESLDLLWSAQE
ncbi:MAG: hypothetical protein V1664_02500 [Candidatus Uhrbacteria bacterium]